MSKSYGNSIMLREPLEEIAPKVRTMFTDKNRLRRSDPGDPAVCNLYPYHELMTDAATREEICKGCESATLGCVDCKKIFMQSLTKFLEPLHERRAELEKDPDFVRDVLSDGNKRARVVARETMEGVRERIGFNFKE